MKRKVWSMAAILVFALVLAAPARAAEYGVIYTETDLLQSAELTTLGEHDLPQFTRTYGIDLRVDVLTATGGFATLEEAAAAIYTDYDYGYGSGKNGLTLTILVHEDEEGVALDGWCVHAGGDSSELTTNGPWNVYPGLNEIMTEENWAGGAEQDSAVLADAVEAVRAGMEHFVLAGGVAGSIWAPYTQSLIETETVPEQTDPDPSDHAPEVELEAVTQEPQLDYETDAAGLLTKEEQPLEQQAPSDALGIRMAIILLVPLGIAGICILIRSTRIKRVAATAEASAHVSGNLNLTGSSDLHAHTSQRHRKIEKKSGSGNSSGDGSGTRGTF